MTWAEWSSAVGPWVVVVLLVVTQVFTVRKDRAQQRINRADMTALAELDRRVKALQESLNGVAVQDDQRISELERRLRITEDLIYGKGGALSQSLRHASNPNE